MNLKDIKIVFITERVGSASRPWQRAVLFGGQQVVKHFSCVGTEVLPIPFDRPSISYDAQKLANNFYVARWDPGSRCERIGAPLSSVEKNL